MNMKVMRCGAVFAIALMVGTSMTTLSPQTMMAQAPETDTQQSTAPTEVSQSEKIPSINLIGGMGGITLSRPQIARTAITKTLSAEEVELAASIRVQMTLPAELKLESIPVAKLAEVLSQQTELPFILDPRGIELADIDDALTITHQSAQLPLKVALRQMLQPLALQADVRDDCVVITAEFGELAKKGHATSASLSANEEVYAKVQQALDKKISFEPKELPLYDAIHQVSKEMNIPIIIDLVALEESGVSPEDGVSIRTADVSARSLLGSVLRDSGLTLAIHGERLEVTTYEVADENLLSRIYWLDGLGEYNRRSDELMKLLRTNIEPDCWEELGGVSTMISVYFSHPNRTGIIAATTLDVHGLIEKYLDTLRASNLGPDQFEDSPAPVAPNSKPHMAEGGMF
jgi:hypothetical protein